MFRRTEDAVAFVVTSIVFGLMLIMFIISASHGDVAWAIAFGLLTVATLLFLMSMLREDINK